MDSECHKILIIISYLFYLFDCYVFYILDWVLSNTARVMALMTFPEAQFLDESHTKVLTFFLLAIHNLALKFLYLQAHETSYSFYSSIIVHCKGERRKPDRKPDRKPYPLPYGSRNPYRNLKTENSQDYAQKPQRNCSFMNSATVCIHAGKLHSAITILILSK